MSLASLVLTESISRRAQKARVTRLSDGEGAVRLGLQLREVRAEAAERFGSPVRRLGQTGLQPRRGNLAREDLAQEVHARLGRADRTSDDDGARQLRVQLRPGARKGTRDLAQARRGGFDKLAVGTEVVQEKRGRSPQARAEVDLGVPSPALPVLHDRLAGEVRSQQRHVDGLVLMEQAPVQLVKP